MEDVRGRLAGSRAALAGLRPALEEGDPWRLSAAYGAEPESDWGPKEVLAHVAEMVPYWLGQIQAVLAAPPVEPVPFGRVVTDPTRIDRIGRDRTLPVGVLLDRIDAAIATTLARSDSLTDEDRARLGAHPRLGEMTVDAIVERFVAGHIEEHVRQLETVLAVRR